MHVNLLDNSLLNGSNYINIEKLLIMKRNAEQENVVTLKCLNVENESHSEEML